MMADQALQSSSSAPSSPGYSSSSSSPSSSSPSSSSQSKQHSPLSSSTESFHDNLHDNKTLSRNKVINSQGFDGRKTIKRSDTKDGSGKTTRNEFHCEVQDKSEGECNAKKEEQDGVEIKGPSNGNTSPMESSSTISASCSTHLAVSCHSFPTTRDGKIKKKNEIYRENVFQVNP